MAGGRTSGGAGTPERFAAGGAEAAGFAASGPLVRGADGLGVAGLAALAGVAPVGDSAGKGVVAADAGTAVLAAAGRCACACCRCCAKPEAAAAGADGSRDALAAPAVGESVAPGASVGDKGASKAASGMRTYLRPAETAGPRRTSQILGQTAR